LLHIITVILAKINRVALIQDEMCYGFMNYYPVETGTGSCISYGSYDECEILDYYEYLDNAANGLSWSALLAMMSLFLILCR